MSDFALKVMTNPYPHTIPDIAFGEMLGEIATGMHAEIARRHGAGVGKAFEHWEYGEDCGTLAYVKPYMLPDGSFVFGHSADVDGTILGASGATEAQDRFLATCFGAEFNYRVTDAHKAWRTENPDSKWFCEQNLPDKAFTATAQLLDDPKAGLLA